MKDLANLDTIDTTLPLPEALSQRLSELSRGLLTSSPEALDKEYHDLFVGSCRGELLPYASWYCCGGLLGPPLLEIRKELSSFGIERKPGASEPEDHAAALLETMAILLEEDRVEPGRQGKFFLDHIDPWIHRFLDDLRHAPSSSFYRLVAALCSEFLAAERRIMQAG
jgi:TorA maturation chaperone TorD